MGTMGVGAAPGAVGSTGAPAARPATRPAAARIGSLPFDRVLAQERGRLPLRFSQHAQQRLASSGVALARDDLERLGRAVDMAASKGARQSLVLLSGTALVVSVPNRTVVTAVSGERMKENVFTNIDSAVIAADAARA